MVLTDREQISPAQAALDGRARFEQWVALYQPRVARLAQRLLGWRADVDDVVQDVFLAALSHAESFRGESSPWTWLAAITINRCRRQQRRTMLWRKVAGWFGARDAAPAADEQIQEGEVNRRVRACVFALPEKEREVVVLYYLEQFSAAEIGRMLGVSVNVVDVRLHRARAKLKRDLAEWRWQ
ncbi:MAG TPA: RNA polymerase sigma factor [Planctomycetota bacterium]|nr:RNA polymerase sigma factor [Planctomycetota bacterium]